MLKVSSFHLEVTMHLSFWLIAGVVAMWPAIGLAQHDHAKTGSPAYAIPESLKSEHSELHADLGAAIKLGGEDRCGGPSR
jgi:hypothetical protein